MHVYWATKYSKLSKRSLTMMSGETWDEIQEGFLEVLVSELHSKGAFYIMVNGIVGRWNHSHKCTYTGTKLAHCWGKEFAHEENKKN